ncbi:MAG: lipoyl synthase [Nitrospinae bacterium]|nr:lipoyl synthase [Nitrospinota bacterium]
MIKPSWLAKRTSLNYQTDFTRKALADTHVSTVCREARCPNMGECFSNRVATFMILGDACSRTCGFCAVEKSRKLPPPDATEPERVAEASSILGLSHVVVTSVTRDDLEDGGAFHFAGTIKAIRSSLPSASVEVLTPDFGGNVLAIDTVTDAGPDVYNHNVETVPELYATVRPKADFSCSTGLLEHVKKRAPFVVTKSGIMLGLGETLEQVTEVMRRLVDVGCDVFTAGQYLRPKLANLPVTEYVRPEVFDMIKELGETIGFKKVFAGPYVRSSYHAGEVFVEGLRKRET